MTLVSQLTKLINPENYQNCKWKMSPSAGKICSANQGMSALSTQTEKKELSVQWFWVTSGSVKSHLVCFMIFWEMKPEKHLSIFQLMEVWQSKQLAQYSVKNSTKIRMYATSLNNNKKSKFSSQSYYDLFFHYTICSLSHQFLAVTEFELSSSSGRRKQNTNIHRKAGVCTSVQGIS